MTTPGWYPDPAGSGGQRWWDGQRWCDGSDWANTLITTPEPVEPPSPGRGVTIAAMVCGIVGLAIGLVPLFGLFALTLGLVAVVLGVIGWRTGRRVGRRQGRAGIILGVLAVILGIVGMVIVSNAFDRFGNSVDCLADAHTAAQVNACD